MLYKMITSYKTMLVLLLILAIGAAVGTFIENDFGTVRAKELVYNAWWYQLSLFLISLNLIAVIDKTKMYRVKARTLFHVSFIIILFGAALTHYFGLDGMMHIREGEKSNIIVIGEEKVETPFYIALKDFTLTRYPGSRSPSEFYSDLTVIDEENDHTFDSEVYMNHTLNYGGYKFFQTSYDSDEKGTKLSVNKDPGVEVTYIGYTLLFLGLILNLFDKKSRFQFLIRKIKNMPIASLLLPLVFACVQTPSYAGSEYSQYMETYLTDHKENSKALASAFGTLVVQGPVGRMKPLDTQNREVLNKLTGRSTWEGMDANQVVLGMFSRPALWKKVNIIKIKTPKLRALLGVEKTQKLVKFTDFFDANATYKLTKEVERANKLVPSRRGTYERDLIRADERLNIAFMSYRGVLLTIFPLANNERNKWVDFKTMFALVDHSQVKRSTSRLLDAAYNRNYDKGFEYIEDIYAFQKEFGKSVMPEQIKLDVEGWFNQTSLFFRLSMAYLLFGLILLVYGMSSMFFNRLIGSKVKTLISSFAFLFFAVHTFGIGLRWYIGGYAPISNTYETMVYIAYASILAGVVFLRKSTIALSASFIMAGIFIFAAYLGEIDPEITSLVPVLKSYWLSIHVSVITASYGFFGVGAILGLITLILFMLRTADRSHMDEHIQNMTYINEVALSLGLTLLVIGNFLGGIWANESWGRYWGWDPKETWALITVLVYAFVTHMHRIPGLRGKFAYNLASFISYSSVMMTYFGVNYFLGGMHSYASGSSFKIPMWSYLVILVLIGLSVFAFRKQQKILPEKSPQEDS